MSESIEQTLRELAATEVWIRVQAAMALPLSDMLELERTATQRALQLLDAPPASFSSAAVGAAGAVAVAGTLAAAMAAPSDGEGEEEATQLANLRALVESDDEAPSYVVDSSDDEAPSYLVDTSDTSPSYVVEADDDTPSYVVDTSDDTPSYVVDSSDEVPSYEEPSYVVDSSDEGPSYLVDSGEEEPSYVIDTEDVSDDETTIDGPSPMGDDFVIELEADASEVDDDEEPTNLHRLADVLAAEDDTDGPSMSNVGQDALVTIDDDSDELFDDTLAGGDDDLVLEEEEEVESFDLMPDLEDDDEGPAEEEVTLISGLDEIASDVEETSDDPSSSEVLVSTPAPRVAPSPRVTAGLYGNPAVPTIREGSEPVPKAAAVQLNSDGGGGRMLGLEEESEPIAVGSADDYGEEEAEYEGDGLSIHMQEYEEEEEEEEEEELELELEEPEPVPQAPAGPTPQEIAAAFSAAQAAAEQGQLQEAADMYSDVIDLDPDHVDAHVGRGRLYLDLGDYSRAMSDFMVAEEIDEQNPEPQVAIGDLYFHRKDYRKAIEYFDAALQMSPNHAMAHCRRGISHYYRKNYRDAVVDLEKANNLDSDIPNISSFISMAKRKAKKR